MNCFKPALAVNLVLILTVNFILSVSTQAEPWVSTSDSWLRSDIETLSDIGVIKVPITTYPLMWSGILKNLDQIDTSQIAIEYKDTYWRVKRAGKSALRTKVKEETNLSFSTEALDFRSFGNSVREKSQFSARRYKVGKNSAWNLEVTRVNNPQDGEATRYDGSYFSYVLGNWVMTVGAVEQWWGPGWDSSNILSNNARPTKGISFTRNYSLASENALFSALGEWSLKGFVNQLDDPRTIEKPYFSGLTFSFKPMASLEASLRLTSISSGKPIQADLILKDKRVTAMDLRWRLPSYIVSKRTPTNVYISLTDEKLKSGLSTFQWGISTQFKLLDHQWRVFLENTNTAYNEFNAVYEDDIYTTGYRYQQRNIGSTYDNDSKVFSLGLMSRLSRNQNLSVKLQSLKLNQINQINQTNPVNRMNKIQAVNDSSSESHEPIEFKKISVQWQYQMDKQEQFDVELNYSDKVNPIFTQSEKLRISLSWKHSL